jgi:hypothetical protein
MTSIAFAVPVTPGKTQDAKAFIAELLGPRRHEFDASRKERGQHRITVFHQQWPTEQFVIYMEADDHHKAMRDHDPSNAFEAWFVKRYEEVTGISPDRLDPLVSEIMMDWHSEKGSSATHLP